MQVIYARNVLHALWQGIDLLSEFGEVVAPRGSRTIEVPFPVTTVYERPTERVLINTVRDANPFFHLMESLWILAGHKDVAFLTKFNARMIDYSDNGVDFHAPYGYRLRHGADVYKTKDQFKEIIKLFKRDISTRRAVLQIWDSMYDLNVDSKDIPCNDMLFFKVRDNKLNMTVANRSNDIIWGAYGANAVQFSMIQEYIAGMIGVEVGEYRQVSDSYHIYPDNPQWGKLLDWAESLDYSFAHHDESVEKLGCLYTTGQIQPYPLVDDPDSFDSELKTWFLLLEHDNQYDYKYKNTFFNNVANPMYLIWAHHKKDRNGLAFVNLIGASDWREGCRVWLSKREVSA